MGKRSNEVVIYWSPLSVPAVESLSRLNMMWGKPVPLLTLVKPGSYKKCSGAKNFFKNTFTFLNPLDVSISVDTNTWTYETNLDAWMLRNGDVPIQGEVAVDYDFSWLFFCEEPMTMKVTPPYLHNTLAQQYGTIASGHYDISKWFRAVGPAYLLWEGNNFLSIKKGDPSFYIEFLTEKKVILKQFESNEEINQMAKQTAQLKRVFPFESLETIYDRFINGNRHKRLLKLIKENLLD
jgi:hypothetical protein